MKRFAITIVCLLLICGAAFYFISIPRGISDTVSTNGVLDLTAAEFNNTFYNLDCDWEFYFGQLYTPDDFRQGNTAAGIFINAHASWVDAGFSYKGCATYRLIVKTNETELLMLIPEISDSSIVWIDGNKVYEAGKPGTTKEETVPGVSNAFVNVRPENGQMEIIVQAANFGWRQNCFRNDIEFGRPGVMMKDSITRRVLLGITIGVMLTMFLYHAILFLYRRKEWVYFVFAIYCLVVAIRFIIEPNSFAQLLMPGGVGAGLIRLHFVLFTSVQFGLLALFTHIVFRIPMRGLLKCSIYAISVLTPLIVFGFLPYGLLDVRVGFLPLITIAITFISAARSKWRKENLYSVIFLFALVAFIIWSPIYVFVFGNTLYIAAIWNNLFLILCQCVMLSVSYAETKRSEEELAEKNQFLESLSNMKSEYLSNLGHEIKTPLTVLSLNLRRAARISAEGGDAGKTQKAHAIAIGETDRLIRMTEAALNLASMQESRGRMSDLDMAGLLASCAESYRQLFEKNGNTLTANIQENMPLITGSPDLIAQVISNLLSNANAHTKNGKVTITAEADNEVMKITITDNGEGVDANVMPRVFMRGVSGRGSTGLGLPLSKNIVESHGGLIELKSKQGQGTTVAFTLPVYLDKGAQPDG